MLRFHNVKILSQGGLLTFEPLASIWINDHDKTAKGLSEGTSKSEGIKTIAKTINK
jgi:hypothetical protein